MSQTSHDTPATSDQPAMTGNHTAPPGTRTLTTSLGQRISVFEGDYIGRKIAEQGLYEKENLGFLLRLLDALPGAVVLDVGANIGNHSLAFATRAAQVHAFEPLPDVQALLRHNVAQNALGNVHCHPLALSDHSGTASLYRDRQGNVGASSLDARQAEADAVTVQLRRGDDCVADWGLQRLDLLKVDVEAHELYVLRGLLESLRRFRPFIAMEWNDPLTIERLRGSEVLAFLQAEYDIRVLGSTWDRGWWRGRPLAFARRKWTRLTRPREVALYGFDPGRLYKNLLLVPRGREGLLPAVASRAD